MRSATTVSPRHKSELCRGALGVIRSKRRNKSQSSSAFFCEKFRKLTSASPACDTLCRGLATGKRPASDTFGTFAILRKVGKSPQFVRYDFAPESGIM
jgi:hypothetical protein